ncbi:3-hydroxybutyryl-CoA dehydrogenase [Paraburkholderia dioscoreae]|uniref:3-hydroxybutyryl-CoA dehydrogenase n=1 Tax=Paraburkholderia dioscoreae TaxID=2604047 RepID=A0A5Q4Z9Y6_9BURK|nr:3-hydroxybutyryl-CoA dehydrogenase [Paraburkholderia dioscoreae]
MGIQNQDSTPVAALAVKSVGIVGSGTMGQGVAQTLSVSGLQVVLIDISTAALEKGVGKIDTALGRLVEKGKLTGADKDAALARVTTSTDYSVLKDVDFVIEAATENVDAKLRIFEQIVKAVSAQTIVSSNTSSISITRLAAHIGVPSRVVGMHFFNPVPLMPLVEVIRGLQTSDVAVETARQLAIAAGKTPIVVANSPGFVVNRLLVPMINEAFFLLGERVATAEEIDAGMKLGANHPLGPLALADMIGLDVCLSVMEVFHADFGDPKYRPSPLLREMVTAGRLGRKTGQGVYSYAA